MFLTYLRNKKIFPIIFVILLTTGVYFVFFKNKEKTIYENKKSAIASLLPSTIEDMGKDSDNDGLKDWEEILWKTDPNNPDTDADKTTDGEEIKQNRNPLVSGPDDKLSPLDERLTNQLEPQTITDTISQAVLNELLMKKQTGDLNSEELASSVVEIVDSLSQPLENAYNIDDLNIFPISDPEKIKQYGNELAGIMEQHFKDIIESELTILAKALEKQDETEFQKLVKLELAYKNVSQEIIEIKVPEALSQKHLDITNSFDQIANELNKISQTLIDPTLGLIGFKQYLTTSQTAYDSLKNLNIYFLNNDITFKENEPGYLFEIYI